MRALATEVMVPSWLIPGIVLAVLGGAATLVTRAVFKSFREWIKEWFESILKEVKPNGGNSNSLGDQVLQVKAVVTQVQNEQETVKADLEARSMALSKMPWREWRRASLVSTHAWSPLRPSKPKSETNQWRHRESALCPRRRRRHRSHRRTCPALARSTMRILLVTAFVLMILPRSSSPPVRPSLPAGTCGFCGSLASVILRLVAG